MIEHTHIGPTVKAFCVGQAKSGTASLYGLLAKSYRAGHEPERAQILEMIRRESRGEVEEAAFVEYLIRRDQRLNLEYDIAWANQFLLRHMVVAFPAARFVVLVRDPYSWLQSIVGHLISREIPSDVRSFLDWWFKPERYPHTRHDRALQMSGTYSIAALLNAWNQHIDSCTKVVPRERRLFLRTHELDRSHSHLAEFLQIPPESLDARQGHLNQSSWAGKLPSIVDGAYLSDMIGTICGVNMTCHFPEVSGIDDVGRLWEKPGFPALDSRQKKF